MNKPIKCKTWERKEKEFVFRNYKTISDKEMANYIDRTPRAIKTFRFRNNLLIPKEEISKRISKNHIDQSGKNNPNYKGGAYINDTKTYDRNRRREDRKKEITKLKDKARNKVKNALRSGRLIKKPCQVCQTTKKVEAHHEDYDRPLEIIWLCRLHHSQYGSGKIDLKGSLLD